MRHTRKYARGVAIAVVAGMVLAVFVGSLSMLG